MMSYMMTLRRNIRKQVLCFRRINTKLPKKAAKPKAGTICVVHLMPHPPLCIWAHPRDRSLQPLYLHYIAMLCLAITNLHIYRNEDRVAILPCWLRGPPPLSPTYAPQQQSLVATPAPAGSNAQGSGHQLWHWSLTAVHQK